MPPDIVLQIACTCGPIVGHVHGGTCSHVSRKVGGQKRQTHGGHSLIIGLYRHKASAHHKAVTRKDVNGKRFPGPPAFIDSVKNRRGFLPEFITLPLSGFVLGNLSYDYPARPNAGF